ncbi:imm11 family protein [Pyxidicoccus sp. 3LFB2]
MADTDYWVLKTDYTSAVIQNLPPDGPEAHTLDRGEPAAALFPPEPTVRFSEDYPKRRKVCDFMSTIFSSHIVSAKVKHILEAQGAKNCEFIPLTLLDHKGKVASKEHFLLQVLGHVEAVDMERSNVVMNSILKDRIGNFKHMVLDRKAIPPDAVIFRLSRKRDEFLVNQATYEALTKEGVTGLKCFKADGWNGLDIY